ncbi:MAG: ParA family protein [Pseudomonadota bacterium]
MKLVSYVFGPFIAVISLAWSRKDRRELIEQSSQLGKLHEQVEVAQAEVAERTAQIRDEQKRLRHSDLRIRKLEDDLRRITEGGRQLWGLRENKPFDKYAEWYLRPDGAKIVTFGNLKGGVGKTTLAANFAGYLSRRKLRVLLVDLDFQGSLSNGLMLAAGIEEVVSRAEMLLEDGANLVTLERAKVHLTPAVDRGWLVPASYPFAQAEGRLLMQWLLPLSGADHQIDVRYRLAHALLRPEVRDSYDVIIFDMPPRMSIGAVNALVASHYLIVPTILDKLSVEAISQFLSQMKAIRSDLGLHLQLGGIVTTMTRQSELSEREEDMIRMIEAGARVWDPDGDYLVKQNLPRREDIAAAAGDAVAYNLPGAKGQALRSFFDPIFDEVLTRIGVIEKAASGPEI